ncbi:hypothetical protein VTI28DRAFT_4644 [Corynascus sepedonium]
MAGLRSSPNWQMGIQKIVGLTQEAGRGKKENSRKANEVASNRNECGVASFLLESWPVRPSEAGGVNNPGAKIPVGRRPWSCSTQSLQGLSSLLQRKPPIRAHCGSVHNSLLLVGVRASGSVARRAWVCLAHVSPCRIPLAIADQGINFACALTTHPCFTNGDNWTARGSLSLSQETNVAGVP